MTNKLTDFIVIILMMVNMVVCAIYLFPSLFTMGMNVFKVHPLFMLKVMSLMSLATLGHLIIAYNLYKFSSGFTGLANGGKDGK